MKKEYNFSKSKGRPDPDTGKLRKKAFRSALKKVNKNHAKALSGLSA